MKVSGFTICRNAVKFDFPVVEAIRSALPIVDEFIVNVGQSDDGTLDLIRSVKSDKIRIVESYWDDTMKTGGLIYSYQTNIALSHCAGDWALYVQADEVLHEADYNTIWQSLHDHLANPAVLGFSFRYLHFYGDYWTTNPWGYHRAVRIIRNDRTVESCGDAVGFWLKADQGYLQTTHKDRVRPSGATIYHYGWVKQAKVMQDKLHYHVTRFHGDQPHADVTRLLAKQEYEFEDYDIMKNFSGSHPAVMTDRVRRSPSMKPGRNRWLRPAFYGAIVKRGFRG